jgi:hypothetical protein
MKYYLPKAKSLMDYQKEKMKKRKNPQKNIKSFPPHPPGGGQH